MKKPCCFRLLKFVKINIFSSKIIIKTKKKEKGKINIFLIKLECTYVYVCVWFFFQKKRQRKRKKVLDRWVVVSWRTWLKEMWKKLRRILKHVKIGQWLEGWCFLFCLPESPRFWDLHQSPELSCLLEFVANYRLARCYSIFHPKLGIDRVD
jgi:hypothetical protein